MRVSVDTELELVICGHTGECPCPGTVFSVRLFGGAYEVGGDELDVELEDIQGLPEGMTLGDVPEEELGRFEGLLEEAALRKRDAQRRLVPGLERIVGMLRRGLQMPTSLAPEFAPHERIGALEFTLRRAKEELEALAKEAA